ncbi:MAG: hypothetical protein ACOCZK_01250 [Planctomycetota bacterium]
MKTFARLPAASAFLCLVLGWGTGIVALGAAEDGDERQPADAAATDAPSASGQQTGRYRFGNPPDGRRDVFYDLVEVLQAELTLVRAAEEMEEGRLVAEAPEIPVDPGLNAIEQAEQEARNLVSRIQTYFNEEQWEQVLREIDRKIDDVERNASRYREQSKLLPVLLQRIRNYRVQAEEKKIYEEARAQFLALDLTVDGIIWAADQESLVIVGGQPKALGVDERVKSCVITNIDVNRVDFMFPYRQRKFHFQRYIGSDGEDN